MGETLSTLKEHESHDRQHQKRETEHSEPETRRGHEPPRHELDEQHNRDEHECPASAAASQGIARWICPPPPAGECGRRLLRRVRDPARDGGALPGTPLLRLAATALLGSSELPLSPSASAILAHDARSGWWFTAVRGTSLT